MFKLILISTAGVTKASERLIEKNPFVIGKEEGIDWTLPDKSTSRRHLQFEKRGNDWWLRDLNSTNGSFVNGEPATEKKLVHNDIIQIGESSFFVNLSSENISSETVDTISKKIPYIHPQNQAQQSKPQPSSPVKIIHKNPTTPKQPTSKPPSTPQNIQRSRSNSSKSGIKKQSNGPDFSQYSFICGCMGFIAFLPAIILGHLDRPNSMERQKLRDRGLVLGYLFFLLWIAGGIYYWRSNPTTPKQQETSNPLPAASKRPVQETAVQPLDFEKLLKFSKIREESSLSQYRFQWIPSALLRKAHQEKTTSQYQILKEAETFKALREFPEQIQKAVILSEVPLLRVNNSPHPREVRLVLEDCFTNPTFWKFNTSLTPSKKTVLNPFIFPPEDPLFFFDVDPYLNLKVTYPEPDKLPWYKAYRGLEWSQGDLKAIFNAEIKDLCLVFLIQSNPQSTTIAIPSIEGKPDHLSSVFYPFDLYPSNWMAAVVYRKSDQKILGFKINTLLFTVPEIETDLPKYFHQLIACKPESELHATPSFLIQTP